MRIQVIPAWLVPRSSLQGHTEFPSVADAGGLFCKRTRRVRMASIRLFLTSTPLLSSDSRCAKRFADVPDHLSIELSQLVHRSEHLTHQSLAFPSILRSPYAARTPVAIMTAATGSILPTTKHRASFSSLPEELGYLVIGWLDYEDLITCKQVSFFTRA